MITVACVYWTNPYEKPLYPVWWIDKLQRMVSDNLLMPHRFVCLSNAEVPCERIPLENNWPRWWSKIELFRPDLFEDEVLYLDLDTVIVNSIGDMFYHGKDFVGLRPFNSRRSTWKDYVASGILSWKNDGTNPFQFLYDDFDLALHAKEFHGDQDYISMKLKERETHITYWQDLIEGIFSYKKHIMFQEHRVEHSRVICFHGEPRPHNLKDDWILGL